jgi:hypothetical protein
LSLGCIDDYEIASLRRGFFYALGGLDQRESNIKRLWVSRILRTDVGDSCLCYSWTCYQPELTMKKSVLLLTALLAVLAVAGCTTVGKAPVGKGPVVAKY